MAQPHQEFPGVPARDIPSFSAEKGEMRGHCGERRHWSLRFEPLISARALPCLKLLVQKGTKFKLRIKLNHKYSTVLLTFFLSLFSCFQMMKELAKMNGAEIQNLYLFQSISPLVISKWEKIFCETYYLIWWVTACLKKTSAYLYSCIREHNYVIILGEEVGVLAIMAYTGRLHPKGFPFLGHVAAAWKRSQQHCLTLTPNKNWNNIERMTCHCFLRTIRRDLPSSSYTTAFFRL